MNKITQSDIDTLAEVKEDAVLTIYMPTHKVSTPATTKEDQARYRNVIGRGLEQWEMIVGPDAIKSAREKLESHIEDDTLWAKTYRSLAILVRKDEVNLYYLPIETDEYVHVGAYFDLAPLRIALSKDQPFYLLALAKHDPKLFYGDSYGLEAVDIDLPSSPEDALNIDEMFSGSNTVRGVGAPGGGNDMLSTHGQGDSNHAGQEEHMKYLRIIDNKILKDKAIDQGIPLLLAATENEASDFRQASNHAHLLERYVAGNHTVTPLQELHALAWPIICEEVVEARINQLVERFNEDKGRQKASSDIAEITEAIVTGRVDTLLLGVVEQTNDSVSDLNESLAPFIRLQNGYQSSGMCDLARAVVEQGGSIVGVERDVLATPTELAALYRY